MFEAGALAKTLDGTFVCPYLIDLSPSDIPSGPLSQFQAKRANEEGTWELLQTLNQAMGGNGLTQDRLRRSFERCWGDLDKTIKALPHPQKQDAKERPQEELLGETLEGVRELLRRAPQSPQELNACCLYSITVAGSESEITIFKHQIARLDGYKFTTFNGPDMDNATELEFAFSHRIDRAIINSTATATGLTILHKTMMREVRN